MFRVLGLGGRGKGITVVTVTIDRGPKTGPIEALYVTLPLHWNYGNSSWGGLKQGSLA
jgi:hypothetical protein